MAKLQNVRGTYDLYGEAKRKMKKVTSVGSEVVEKYGFEEIETPIFEFTEVFSRNLGETSDVVTKEMYCFEDRGGESLTLRPEGTAGVVRSFVSEGMQQNLPVKLYYSGPMFRYERPQKGRQRQFTQFGCELLGVETPQADIEVIAMAYEFLEKLGLTGSVTVEINSLGDRESRDAYREKLVAYLKSRYDELSEDSKTRLERNPLRVLDSKEECDKAVVEDAPLYKDSLNEASSAFFNAVLKGLDNLGIKYKVNDRLVRGLDYYSHTVFELVTDKLGSQGTVLESYPELIAREDRDIAASVKETLEKKGIVFRMNAKVQSVNRVEDKAIVTFADSQTNEVFVLEADAVLLATGRRPNTKDLNLEVAGVEVDVCGAIIVDEYLKTTNPNIRAVGDVKGGLQFTYISLDDYRIVREDLFGDKERRTGDRNPVSYSVFIDPPLSRIGLNEEEARRQNRDIIVKKLPVMAIPRAKTLGETDGLLKAIIDKNTGKILGCVLFAPDSGEVINTVAVAMKTGQDYTFLRDFIFTHPSMSEALNDLFS